jgi:hypothetical protein
MRDDPPVPDVVPETCEACGREFGCGVNSGLCWCALEDVSPGVLASLSERYDRCLCPPCLEAASAAEAAPAG